MSLTYDPSWNVAWIRLRERQGDVETIELTSDFLADAGGAGTVCGIELLKAIDQFARGDDGKLIEKQIEKQKAGKKSACASSARLKFRRTRLSML